jgi:hypothetical protein
MDEVRVYVLAALAVIAAPGIGWMLWRVRKYGWWDED